MSPSPRRRTGPIERAVRRDLREHERLGTTLGAQALAIAAAMDTPRRRAVPAVCPEGHEHSVDVEGPDARELATLGRELRMTMKAAMAEGEAGDDDALDRFADRVGTATLGNTPST